MSSLPALRTPSTKETPVPISTRTADFYTINESKTMELSDILDSMSLSLYFKSAIIFAIVHIVLCGTINLYAKSEFIAQSINNNFLAIFALGAVGITILTLNILNAKTQ